jgi:hypothetical protein
MKKIKVHFLNFQLRFHLKFYCVNAKDCVNSIKSKFSVAKTGALGNWGQETPINGRIQDIKMDWFCLYPSDVRVGEIESCVKTVYRK